MEEAMTGPDVGMTLLDLACGIVQSIDASVPSLPDVPAGLTTRGAIGEVLSRAWEHTQGSVVEY